LHLFNGKEPRMRLFTLLPSLCSMARPAAPIAAIAFCIGGCSGLDHLSGGTSSYATYPVSSNLYLTSSAVVTADRDYIDRYVCANEKPLVCQCLGRISSSCDCHC
jgi:hypothetical protein